MNLIIIDNYDSFTFNLSHLVKQLGAHCDTVRNDQFQLSDLEAYDKIILSPGPGIPSEAGLLLEVIRTYAGRKPMLGVCLGHQAIGEAFGARLENLSDVFHGVQTPIRITAPDYLFEGIPQFGQESCQTLQGESGKRQGESRKRLGELSVGRYHSWVVSKEGFPASLEITAESEEGQIMALRHRTFDIRGIQFHPESVLTPDGATILRNWLNH